MNGTLATRLKEIREANGWTQQEFAELIKCSRATYNHYENGNRHPDDEIIKRICLKTGISADYLLGLSTTKNPAIQSAQEVTGFSEKTLEYLSFNKNRTNTKTGQTGIENKVLDFIVRDADNMELFMHQNPHPYQGEIDMFPPPVPKEDVHEKCHGHILDAIKNDWGDSEYVTDDPSALEEEEIIESLGGWGEICSPYDEEHTGPIIPCSELPNFEYKLWEEKLPKNIEKPKAYFLDSLIDYLLFDKYDIYLCSESGSYPLSEKRDIAIRLGNVPLRFPSEDSSALIETMLLQRVMDALKAMKERFNSSDS